MKDSAVQHVLGVFGQVAAVLPLLLITVYLSRRSGLETAGLFTVMVGVSAAMFSSALWGLRTSILLDRFVSLGPNNYLAVRVVAMLIASTVVVIAGVWLNLDFALVIGVILFRICDGLVDLNFAMTQVWQSTSAAIRLFAVQHLFKLAILAIVIITGMALQSFSVQHLFAGSGAVIMIMIWRSLIHTIDRYAGKSGEITAAQVWQVFVDAAWFAIAAGVCAVVTSAPRLSLNWLYEGDQLGVIGISLSVSTFFGMVFYTSWIRYLPRFASANVFNSTAIGFLGENFLVTVISGVFSWFVLPVIVGLVFGFGGPEQTELAKNVLIASVVFFAGMNVCNLYKVTGSPWMETVTYMFALVLTLLCAIVFPALREIESLLLIAGFVVLLGGVLSLVAPARNDTSKSMQ